MSTVCNTVRDLALHPEKTVCTTFECWQVCNTVWEPVHASIDYRGCLCGLALLLFMPERFAVAVVALASTAVVHRSTYDEGQVDLVRIAALPVAARALKFLYDCCIF